VGSIEQVREPDPSYQIGSGKVKELAELVSEKQAERVIFDNELKPQQAYKLEIRVATRQGKSEAGEEGGTAGIQRTGSLRG